MKVPVTDVLLTITPTTGEVPLGEGGVAWTIQVEDQSNYRVIFTVTGPNLYTTVTLPDGDYVAKGWRQNSINGVVGSVVSVAFTITTTMETVDMAESIGHNYTP